LLSEHRRFFWGDRVIVFSVIFFVALISNFKQLKKRHKDLIIYMGIIVFSLNVFGSHVAERYLLFYYGFMAFISAIWLVSLREHSHVAFRIMAVLLVTTQLIFAGKELYDI